MLFYTFFYLVSAVLVLQGTQLVGEQREAMGAVPEELVLPASAARVWGRILMVVGLIGVVCGLASHGEGSWVSRQVLAFIQGAQGGLAAVYGLWLVFVAKRVAYAGVAAAPAEHHH